MAHEDEIEDGLCDGRSERSKTNGTEGFAWLILQTENRGTGLR